MIMTAVNASGGMGLHAYQWQNSANNAQWIDIAGATSINYPPRVMTNVLLYVVTVRTSAPFVPGFMQEDHHSVMLFANFALRFVVPVLPSVRNTVATGVQNSAENVQQSAKTLLTKQAYLIGMSCIALKH